MHLELYMAPIDSRDFSRVLVPVAVKEEDQVAWVHSENMGNVVSLGTLEEHWSDSQRRVDVKSVGHCW
jgi:hypothetical protein